VVSDYDRHSPQRHRGHGGGTEFNSHEDATDGRELLNR
jgi:hypothetical protein